MSIEKTLDNVDTSTTVASVSDVKIVGNPDIFKLLCKASSETQGWMKSTKAMEVQDGCVVQVSTHQRNHDGTNAVAETICYVPGVKIAQDTNGGNRLVGISGYAPRFRD